MSAGTLPAARADAPAHPLADALAECESRIERAMTTVTVAVGADLATIRAERLYLATHKTFDAYCQDRWRFTVRRAQQLMAAAQTAEQLMTRTNVRVTSEGQARAIGTVIREHGPDTAALVLEEAAAGGSTTAKSITAAAGRVIGDHGPAPRVVNNSGNHEWYTPPHLIETARRVFQHGPCPHDLHTGTCGCNPITVDPAASAVAQKYIQAEHAYTVADDGLTKPWAGNVWLNPPYVNAVITAFLDRLYAGLDSGDVRQAIVLTNAATETAWGQRLIARSAALCFPAGRVRYLDATGEPANSPLQGQMVAYLHGPEVAGPGAFRTEFAPLGCVK